MRLTILLALTLFASGLAQGVGILDSGSSRFMIVQQTITATSIANNRLLWRQRLKYSIKGILGIAENVLVIQGSIFSKDPVFSAAPLPVWAGLNPRTGAKLWEVPATFFDRKPVNGEFERLIGGLLIYQIPNGAYAMCQTGVISVRTGREVLNARECFRSSDADFAYFINWPAPVPYGDEHLYISRINLQTHRLERKALAPGIVDRCSLDYSFDPPGADIKELRFSTDFIDVIYKTADSCEYVFARFRWNLPSSQTPVIRRILGPIWPQDILR